MRFKTIAIIILFLTSSIAAPAHAALVKRENPVSDASYGAGWNGDTTHAPSKNAVYAAGFLQAEVDGSTTNEIQDLSLDGNTLSLSGDATTVDLSGYLDNTDDQTCAEVSGCVEGALTEEVDGSITNEIQDLSLDGNTLSLTGDETTVDLSGYLDNTDAQDLSLDGNTLSLSGDATTVDLSGYLDNTDDQTCAEVSGCVEGAITGNQSITLSGDVTGTGTTAITTTLAANKNTGGFGFTFDGNGSALVAGTKIRVPVRYAFTITGWQVVSTASGNVVIDINFGGSSVAGTEKPTLSSSADTSDVSLTTWTDTSVAAGDVWEAEVDSGDVTNATVLIFGAKT